MANIDHVTTRVNLRRSSITRSALTRYRVSVRFRRFQPQIRIDDGGDRETIEW